MILYLYIITLLVTGVNLRMRMVMKIRSNFDRIVFHFLICIVLQISVSMVDYVFIRNSLRYLALIINLIYTLILYMGFRDIGRQPAKKKEIRLSQNILLLAIACIFAIKTVFFFFYLTADKKYVPFNMPVLLFGCVCELFITCYIYYYQSRQLQLMLEQLPVESDPEQDAPISDRYYKSKINPESMDNYKVTIDSYLLEKPFLRQGFGLEEMASDLKIYKHQCSQIINEVYQMNFPQLVNSRRIEYACHLLEEPDICMGMEELAEHCGFNSKASFYRNFKELRGCSPLQYSQRCSRQ